MTGRYLVLMLCKERRRRKHFISPLHLSAKCKVSFPRHGYGGHLERWWPASGLDRSPQVGLEEGREGGRMKCRVRLTGEEGRSMMETCDHCVKTKVVNVSNAWYADCNGLYSLTNLTAVWDPKRVVYERIEGGLKPQEER